MKITVEVADTVTVNIDDVIKGIKSELSREFGIDCLCKKNKELDEDEMTDLAWEKCPFQYEITSENKQDIWMEGFKSGFREK